MFRIGIHVTMSEGDDEKDQGEHGLEEQVVNNMCTPCIGLVARWNIMFWQLSVFGRICVQTRNASDTAPGRCRRKS